MLCCYVANWYSTSKEKKSQTDRGLLMDTVMSSYVWQSGKTIEHHSGVILKTV